MKIKYLPHCIFSIVLILFLIGCKSDVKADLQEELVIRLPTDISTLSPILTRSVRDVEVYEFMFISLGDYDPVTLDLIPVMIREIPKAIEISEGPYKGGDAYTMQMKDGATWEDGSPITGKDVLFTLKMAAHPDVQDAGWKALIEDIYNVEMDPDDPTSFTISTTGDYFLNLEMILSAEIYPQYLFDSSGVIGDISLPEIKTIGSEDLLAKYPEVSELSKTFSSAKYSQEIIEGAGPYRLSEWKAGQYVVLEKKENYWGDRYPENTILQGHFKRLIFQVIQDETVALTLLKNDEIDVLNFARSPYLVFDDLKSDKIASEDLELYSVDNFRNNLILLNNEDARLKDPIVRQALSMLTDVDRMLEQIEGGYGSRINSIINPSKSIHNKTMPYVQFNIAAAKTLLDEAGWIDADGNGIRDKMVDGVKRELSFEFLITASATSAAISSIVAQSASEAQIEITPVVKNFSKEIISELLPKGNFDMSVFVISSSASLTDPYTFWHSGSLGLQGKNYTRYNNPAADQIIDRIREKDIEPGERVEAYYELQRIMAADYPVIFLYAPETRFAVDNDIAPVLSAKKPGFFANASKMR